MTGARIKRDSTRRSQRVWRIVGVVVLCATLGATAVFVVRAATTPDTVGSRPALSPVTVTVPPEIRRVTPMPSPRLARKFKPLQDLVPGDRVLYDAGDGRPTCVFVTWFGSIATAQIDCPNLPTLTVETGFLTSAEPIDATAPPLSR